MVDWRLFYAPEAVEELSALDATAKERIRKKLRWLVENFDNITPTSLGGAWRGFFKLRVGDWRIIYDIDWENRHLLVVAVGHRSDIYKR